ncbi:hypothetical protein EW146_g8180 [Bondarzewia mesenterica]|uniref:C2H2-type domain-containing protein n=1 Tax=Bondarzewia mesenterica TaxID=1095465 RepID=A0A4S4LM04_9AGAM|nr:hypothetical protein EW146_g8180 [Bondarzewia mesenterica]
MFFSLFSKKSSKQSVKPNEPANELAAENQSPIHQLRTPSPSEAPSTAQILPAQPSPTPSFAHTTSDPQSASSIPPPTTSNPTDSASLQSLLTNIPPRTLHTYTLSRLPTAPADTLAALSSFFSTLTPPPLLHCIRCHKDFTEVENADRSCLVPHDDDSAEVERVGRARKNTLAEGPEYETLWGCCGKTVEGDGDQGPPDGWCYEGKHTTDIKRARFRADSTLADDKLVSCIRLNCHGVRSALPRSTRASNKRPRPAKAEEDETDSEGAEDSGVDEIIKGVDKLEKKKEIGKPRAKGKAKDKPDVKGKGKAEEKESEAEQGNVVVALDTSKGDSSNRPIVKPRDRARKRKQEESDDAVVAELVEKKGGGKKKAEEGGKGKEKEKVEKEKETPKKRKAPPRVVVSPRPASVRPKTRAGKEKEIVPETGDEKMDVDEEEKGKEGKRRKRRKVVPTPGAE